MIDEILTMIPGPTPVHPRILARLAEPTVSHLFPAFVSSYKESLANFREIMRSESGQPFIFAGGGTLAMEVALVNTVAPGEKILILSQGYFGDRFRDLAESFGIECDIIQSEWGHEVTPEQLQAKLKDNHYSAVTITHVDTSTGTCAPVREYCELLSERDELVILDGVCASAGIDERFDQWGIDVLLTAPQKAFGAPPGLALCLFSKSAIAKRKSFKSVPAYYADILRWLPIMENPGKYYSTPAVNEITAFHESTLIILEEGLDKRFSRHEHLAEAFRAGLQAIELHPFTAPHCMADTLSLISYPKGVNDAAFRTAVAQQGVVIAGSLGPIAGQAFRVGHMGNIGIEEICKTLEAIELGLISCGRKVEAGIAVAAASRYLKW